MKFLSLPFSFRLIHLLMFIAVLVCHATNSLAQVLPKGIGAYYLGYRQFSGDPQLFDSDGRQYSAGEKFNLDFSAQGMASGNAGSDLERLYSEIKKFEPQGAEDSVADDMNFGQLTGDVRTSINAKIAGGAYGLTDKFTVFGGVPFVSAAVDTKLSFTGGNNAAEIKARLGDLVFQEIQDGLDRASRLSEANIREQLEVDKGYAPIDHWEYNGLGDTVLGVRTEFQGQRIDDKRLTLGLLLQGDLATGHADDPDILTDIPIGKGYHALTLASDSRITFTYLAMGVKNSLTQGMPRQVQRRIPEGNDKVVAADRKASVDWTPGRDFNNSVYSTLGNSWLRGTYTLGIKRHFSDKYAGSLAGNYGLLAESSDAMKTYHEAAVTVTSVRAFSRNNFKIPLIFTLSAHDSLSGRNAAKETYFELTVASFFSTPAADSSRGERKADKNDHQKSVTKN